MRATYGISWFALTILWFSFAQARAAGLPYLSFPCRELPTADLLSLPPADWPFPDADDRALEQANYLELASYSNEYSALTIMSDQPGFATVFHYSPDGICYIPQPGMLLPADHHLTICFELPLGQDSGITRLVFWQEQPEQSWLSLMASQPNFIGDAIPGVLAQRWYLRRQQAAFLQPPWEDQLREKRANPYGYSSAWPYSQATLTSSGIVLAKDCSVDYHGPTTFAGDAYGVYGRWSINWGTPVKLQVYLPEEIHPYRCELYLYGTPAQSFGLGGMAELEIGVNGWLLPDTPYGAPAGGSELFVYSVSQYIEAGMNDFAIGLDSFSGEEWLLERVELWLE